MTRWAMLASACFICAAAQVIAQPVINGTLVGDESFYGAALSIQNSATQFGDAITGDPANGGGGSEIDQVFATIANSRLYMLITGNLETNFNKLSILIDSVDGGVNSIVGNALPGGVDSFCCGGLAPPRDNNTTNFGALQRMDGMTFDAGFNADYLLTYSQGIETVAGSTQFWAGSAHFADLTQGTTGNVVRAGMILAPQGMPNVLRDPGAGLGDAPAVPDDPFAGFGTMYGPALPGLSTGQLIDRDYALSANGGCMDDTGAGCVATELEFALDVDPSEYLIVNADYNQDGIANAADYAVWRDNLGENIALPGENPNAATPGVVDAEDYEYWKENYGNNVGTGEPNASNHRDFRNTIDLQLASDNSNAGGVNGSGGPDFVQTGDPENVVTGIEFSLPLSELGNPAGDIRLLAFINGSGHNFASNQFAGEGILGANPGGDGMGGFTDDLQGVNLNMIDGDQFVTIAITGAAGSAIPEPSAVGLFCLALGAAMIGCPRPWLAAMSCPRQ